VEEVDREKEKKRETERKERDKMERENTEKIKMMMKEDDEKGWRRANMTATISEIFTQGLFFTWFLCQGFFLEFL
jgi:hypothetical protein